MQSLCAFAVLVSAASLAAPTPVADPTPLSDLEWYLEPYLGELVQYRDNPVIDKYVSLANLVDALPTWIENFIIRLFVPHSTVTIPVNAEIPFKIPIGNFSIPLPGHFTIKTITINDLNKFKTLKPIKLMPDTKFTWGGHVSMHKTKISVDTELVVLGKTVNATFTLPLAKPDLQYSLIMAFNRTRLCDLWGGAMESSTSCGVWPMFVDEPAGISGFNLTSFTVSVSDFDFQIDVHGLGDLDDELKKELATVVDMMKPGLIANLPGSISAGIRSRIDSWAVGGVADMHRKSPCSVDALRPAINVSQVCFLNNANFNMKWAFHNCPAHQVSHQTDAYPRKQYECRNVQDLFPNIVPGQVIRVATEAVHGFHELIDPAFRFQPEAASAGFECDGSKHFYKCGFVSVAPVDDDTLPEVEQVCVVNHGSFTMNFKVRDMQTGKTVETEQYKVNQKQCVDLGNATTEGSELQVEVDAVGGLDVEANRHITYKRNGYSATYQCQGTKKDYRCNLLVEPKFTVPQVDRVCVTNRGKYAMSFDATDLRTGLWHGGSFTYRQPKTQCLELGETFEIAEGDKFEIHAFAKSHEAIADSHVEYKAGGGTATYQCGGTTTTIHCELLRDANTTNTTNTTDFTPPELVV